MQDLHQLFVHELQDVWAAEQTLAGTLDRMSRESTTPELQQVFSTHQSETQTHIARLRQVFDAVGAQPNSLTCEGMEGIIQEHDRFVAMNQPSPPVHAAFAVGASEKVEHYEIAAYEGLLRLANAIGLQHAVGPIQANLADERQQLTRLQNVGRNMNLQQMAVQPTGQQPRTTGRQQAQPLGPQ